MQKGDFVEVQPEFIYTHQIPHWFRGLVFPIYDLSDNQQLILTPYFDREKPGTKFKRIALDADAVTIYATAKEFYAWNLDRIDLVDDVFNMDFGFEYDPSLSIFPPPSLEAD